MTNCGQNMIFKQTLLLSSFFVILALVNSCTYKSKCDKLLTEDGYYFMDKDSTAYTGTCETSVYGIKKIQNFKDGRLSGQRESYAPTGELLSSTSYRNGKRNGWNILYYPNGNKEKEGKYIDDKKNGIFKSWYGTGDVKSEGKYVKGERYGTHTEWHPNSQKKRGKLLFRN